jgi:hypothetical protein
MLAADVSREEEKPAHVATVASSLRNNHISHDLSES